MRIKLFNRLLGETSQRHILKDCDIVIDAQNFFYSMYEKSKLPFEAGCESDRFAIFLKKELRIFKNANVQCYFVFKGGSKNFDKKTERKLNADPDVKTTTMFMSNICKQVLDEMGFDYVTCQFEAKEQCIAIANKLKCPVMSNDIEVGILSNSYVNYYTSRFDPVSNIITCKLTRFSGFLKKYGLSKEKFAIFVLLTDETIFPEGYFNYVLKKLGAPELLPAQYLHLLKWLSQISRDEAFDIILQGFNPDEKNGILQKEKEIRSLFGVKSPGVPYQYFLEKNKIEIKDKDLQWFEKGIAARYIPKPYIYLYSDAIAEGSEFRFASKPDAILLSIDIFKYAFNLLTNYSRDSLEIFRFNGDLIKVSTKMPDVPKPEYTACNVVFENGWSGITQLELFEHFVRCTIKGFDFEPLRKLRQDAKLLMITLIYVAHKSETWGAVEAYSVIFSYVRLCDSSCSDIATVKAHDLVTAVKDLEPFLLRQNYIETDILYPLIEFQHCLEQFNNLNALCGFPYKPTVYSKTYNATLVYNILRQLKNTGTDAFVQISQLLKSAPTVVTYFKKLVDTHKEIMPFKN